MEKGLNSLYNQWKMFFGHDLELQTGFTETSEPVLEIFPFCLALMRLKVFRVLNLQFLEILNEIFIFEISTDGPPVGKLPCSLIFPHRWPPVVHRWPVVGYHGLSVREYTNWDAWSLQRSQAT